MEQTTIKSEHRVEVDGAAPLERDGRSPIHAGVVVVGGVHVYCRAGGDRPGTSHNIEVSTAPTSIGIGKSEGEAGAVNGKPSAIKAAWIRTAGVISIKRDV